jgi:hypothetical protein
MDLLISNLHLILVIFKQLSYIHELLSRIEQSFRNFIYYVDIDSWIREYETSGLFTSPMSRSKYHSEFGHITSRLPLTSPAFRAFQAAFVCDKSPFASTGVDFSLPWDTTFSK